MLSRDHNKKTQFPQPANTPYPTVRTAPIPSPATPPFVPRCVRSRCHRPWRLATAVRGLASRALARAHLSRRAPLPYHPLVSRSGRARCPHRAAAPHGAVRGLASRAPSPCTPTSTAITTRITGRRDGDIAPYRHYTRPLHPCTVARIPSSRAPSRALVAHSSRTPTGTAITHAHDAGGAMLDRHRTWRLPTARGGSPPHVAARHPAGAPGHATARHRSI